MTTISICTSAIIERHLEIESDKLHIYVVGIIKQFSVTINHCTITIALWVHSEVGVIEVRVRYAVL